MSSTQTILFLFFFTILSSSFIISPTLSFSTTNTNYTPKSTQNPKYTSFVKNACNTTTYPSICLKTCLPYATKIACDGLKLVTSALSVTLTATKSATSTVTTLSLGKTLGKYEYNLVKDCIENMGDSISDLKQSIQEMKDIEEYNINNNTSYKSHDVGFKVSNIKTWMSAAITNENTCMDGIKEGKVSPFVKDIIRKSILSVAKLTSNSLCLCNNIQY